MKLPRSLEPAKAALERAVRPCYVLTPGDDPTSPGAGRSKSGRRSPLASGSLGAPLAKTFIGGRPFVGAGFDWPRSPARPMSFIGQLDLAELSQAGAIDVPLRSEGTLLLFYDLEEGRWGFAPEDRAWWRVVYLPPRLVIEAKLPAGVEAIEKQALAVELADSLPSPMSVDADAMLAGLAEEAREDYWDLFDALVHDAGDEGRHQIGGHADWVEDDGRWEAELVALGKNAGDSALLKTPEALRERAKAVEWELLWQIPSDEERGIVWGEGGRLYLLGRREDLAAGKLDALHLTLQGS